MEKRQGKQQSLDDSGLTVVKADAAEQAVIQIVLDALPSEHSRRAYERALREFFIWRRAANNPALSKALVQRYAAELREKGLSASAINQQLSAIRKLVAEAADNNLLDQQTAVAIKNVRGARQEGRRIGNWLTQTAAQSWLNAPDCSTLKGLRDRALLAVLLGGGLRRAEAAALTFEHFEQREGRWAIVDLFGKRDKARTIPVPAWMKAAIDEWSAKSGVSSGAIFRRVNKADCVAGNGITAQAIRNIVHYYSLRLADARIAPHDLRRTFAKLSYAGGAKLDQIQLSLGHESIGTTEKYLGVEQDYSDAPCDRLGLKLNRT